MGKKFNAESHHLVPKHTKLSDAEAKKLFERYDITAKELPKILNTDPVIEAIGAKAGDVVKINRKSETAGEMVYYREVVDE